MLNIYTSHYTYNGVGRFDITYKANSIFSPTMKLVYKYKYDGLDQDTYTKTYYELMRNSYKKFKQQWVDVLNLNMAVFVCYCREDSFCHRQLLTDILLHFNNTYFHGELVYSKEFKIWYIK